MMNQREREIYKVTLVGTVLNAVLIAMKFIAGLVGRSSAMVADAVHSLSDFITDIIVVVFVKVSSKPSDAGHDYGHGKFETFATMIIGLILLVAGAGLFINGGRLVIESLYGTPLPAPSMLALVIAVVSILSKEGLYRYTVAKGAKLNSNVVIANGWHHRSDALSSLGTLAGVAGAMFLGEKWRILDPIAAIVVSFFIVKAGYDVIKPSINELLEGSLSEQNEKDIRDIIMSVPGVAEVHNLRTRRIGNEIAIDFHAGMDGGISLTDAHLIASEAERLLKMKYGQNTFISVHMEPFKMPSADCKC